MRPRWPLVVAPIVLVGLAAGPTIWRVGEVRDGRRMISTGQTVTVDPKAVSLPARGLDMALSADLTTAFAKTTRGVARIDLADGKVVAEARLKGGMSMCGIDVAEAGVLVTDATQSLLVLDPATLEVRKTIDLGKAAVGGPCYPCGVKAAGDIAYVALNRGNTLAIVNLTDGSFRTVPAGLAPYGVQVQGDRVFVTCWGREPGQDKEHAPSAGVEVETENHGGASGGSLVELDREGKKVREWKIGTQPTEIAATPDTIYVACANDDSVVKITAGGKMSRTRLGGPPGAAPSSLALVGDQLWVALSGENRVMAIDTNTGRTQGTSETGWYPVAVRGGEGGLVVLDAKGDGTTRKSVGTLVGQVRVLPAVGQEPLPKTREAKGRRLPVKRAVYIIKENRTYDQVFGDLPQGKGDPSLTMYGREVTPNHHAIAEQFVLLDNFADNGSVSTDGHAWAIEGQATTFYERSFGGWTRAYPFGGDEPVAVSRGGHLWDAALAAGKSFRNYGEFMYANDAASFSENYKAWKEGRPVKFTGAIGVKRVRAYTCPDFPGWNLNIPDGYRADVFLKEFREMEAKGSMPDLTTIYLPQDHTSGNAGGAPTPRASVADNDLAVGRIVDAISHSKFWKDTVIFVLEDDPQDGLDSVDGHRSLCLVASPYTRRGTVVSTFYNQTSVLHTICRILGAKPYTRFIAESAPMDDLFGDKADLTPYTAVQATIPLDQLNPIKRTSVKLDLSGPDATDEEVMDRVLWSMAFPHRPYPHDAEARKDD